ncbi:Ubiquitin carboxyl-terminal hydrolases family 2 [Macleaya cordata]|uniref:Ubiquitin carboxyl-terminal hydrolase n=1 Tax=Macleaya cordata TaxID=56857 RepID=A0A200Q9Q1_MACCD|nr:Ubiquitin carboxyl-terminal hydrolases family 2 [Macleaya cordata]
MESSEDLADVAQPPITGDERVYVVPYKWWKEAQDSSDNADENRGVLYTASSTSSYAGAMKIINNIFNSDLAFNLRREEESLQNGQAEEGISGRDYALVPGEMWLQALKWHSDCNVAAKDAGSFSVAEDDMADVYPLQLRLSILRETNSLAVKISKKDNAAELYKRACKIFNVEYEQLRIWDFSGQTTLFFMSDRNKFPKDCQRQSDSEILLELQVYGLSDSMKCREGKKDESATQQSKMAVSSFRGSVMNGSTGNMDLSFSLTNSPALSGGCGGAGSLGLTGLQNLGNTCFMNSAIQCLAHTPKLVDYFLGDYSQEINPDNPLGMDGELALAFGDLLRKLWAPGAAPVAPRLFKSKLAHFAPQFSGFNQHDSQELLAFLLDGLHEDLNRVKCKPYVEAKDAEGRKDEEVADEYWRNHLARNDSIIVDICQGQYKSTLVCPVCNKVSVTFDPFMYLSLPLPSTMMRTMTVTVLSTDGSSAPSPFTITVPKYGKCKDLIQALSTACSLRTDETLLVAEIYNNRIIRYLEEPSDSLSLIRDDDRLAAYRLPKDHEELPLVVFMHERMEEQYIYGKLTSSWKAFAIPLVARLHNIVNGSDISDLYLKLLRPAEVGSDDTDNSGGRANDEVSEMVDTISLPAVVGDASGDKPNYDIKLEFFLTDEKGTKMKDSKLEMNEPVSVTGLPRRLNVLVCWQDNMVEHYDTRLLSSLPEISKSGFLAKRPQDSMESVSLYSCLEAFLKDEPLGPEDMWYCPGCLKHRQASKKLDLWRLPEILIIHLKRFSYSRFMKNKLETFVNFPIHDLDLSAYIACKNGQSSYRYVLYAVSNHYGSMGGGHYTAFVYHGGNQWFDFDDSHVSPVSEDKIKTSAAYVLFYRRVLDP